MKRISALVLVLCLLFSGCGRKQEPGVTYPEPAEPQPCALFPSEITEAEQPHLQDLAHRALLSFRLSAEADGMKLILFKLHSGSWEDLAGGGWSTLSGSDWDSHGTARGKLLIQFDRLWDTCQVSGADGQQTLLPLDDPEGKLTALNTATAFLSSTAEASWESLIPVAVQVVSHQDRVLAPGLDIWEHPEAYENQGYEAVYLLAVAFRESTYESPVETFS